MKFIDHTGHLFQLKSYNIEPIGYEYEETKYIFWFENESGYKISVDTYAIKPIRVLFDTRITNIEVTLNSNKFSLISGKIINDKIDDLKSYNESIVFDENDENNELYGIFVHKLSYNQLQPIKVSGLRDFSFDPEKPENEQPEYTLVTFYVAVKSSEAGTWQSNVLIKANHFDEEEWCPFTIAAEIVDECEELIINGQNMGVQLPKDILKAVYQSSYYNDVPDESFYAQKLKEYLMNFMDIKGQTGNYKSAITGLKWFGWGDKLDIYKLLKTDNEFQHQYIRDNFDIINDTIYSYRFFKNESLLAISLRLDEISEETEGYTFNTDKFWGEDKPSVSDLMNKNVVVHYDEADLDFYRSYFDYTFNELGLKLCMLKYYYDKYFLPIHMSVNSLSMIRQTFANDIKYISNCSPKLTADPVFIKDSSINISFPKVKELFLTAQYHNVDENFIEFNFDYEGCNAEAKYSLYETCVNVPIKFESTKENQYYDTILTLYKDDTIIYSRNFQFNELDLIYNDLTGKHEKINFIIHPKTFNRYLGGNDDNIKNEKLSLNLWLNSKYTINLYVNGNNYSYEFTLRLPDFGLKMGKLQYQYSDNFRQLYKDENQNTRFLSFMWMPGAVTINNIDFIDDLYLFQDNMNDYVNKCYKTHVNIVDEKKYLNKCHLYKLLELNENDNKYYEINYTGLNFSNSFNLNLGTNGFLLHSDTQTDLTPNSNNLTLYKQFFDIDNTSENNFVPYKSELSILELEENAVKYDFYLMHNENCWYVVLISKDTIESFTNLELEHPTLPNIGKYKFEYEFSDEKVLINRYNLIPTNGVNKFNDKDIIAFYLEANKKLPYKIGLSTKWLIKPMSIGMSNDCKVESPSEIAIVSIGDNNFKYQKGYYNVVCRYSLDDFYQESEEKKGIFMVE